MFRAPTLFPIWCEPNTSSALDWTGASTSRVERYGRTSKSEGERASPPPSSFRLSLHTRASCLPVPVLVPLAWQRATPGGRAMRVVLLTGEGGQVTAASHIHSPCHTQAHTQALMGSSDSDEVQMVNESPGPARPAAPAPPSVPSSATDPRERNRLELERLLTDLQRTNAFTEEVSGWLVAERARRLGRCEHGADVLLVTRCVPNACGPSSS